jgi:pimeloyl-ACP methyl ester carboxylesterase
MEYSKRDLVVDGVRVEVLEAGNGEPLVYFHGAGTLNGFNELLRFAEKRRLIVPIHPGFGASADDANISTMLDYVIHYGALFDQLELGRPFDLVGQSLGGWMASMFAVVKGHRVRRLTLACPAGLQVPEHPTADLFMIRPEALPSYLVASPELLAKMTAVEPTAEMKLAGYRETTTLARLIWDRNYETKLKRWLGHIEAPTLVLWGERDGVIPVEQSGHWTALLRNSQAATFEGAGHLLFLEAPQAIDRTIAFLEGA